MKKIWVCYWVISAVIVGASAVGAALLFRVFWALTVSALLFGVSVAAYLFARFYALEYEREDDVLIIRGGILIRTEHRLPLESILWHTGVSLGSERLFTVLYTASGRAVVFADFEK